MIRNKQKIFILSTVLALTFSACSSKSNIDENIPACGDGTDRGLSIAVDVSGKTINKVENGSVEPEIRLWHFPNGDKLACMVSGEATITEQVQ